MKIEHVVTAYANVLYTLFEFYYDTSFNLDAGIYLLYEMPGIVNLFNVTFDQPLGNITFNETMAGDCETSFPMDELNSFFNQTNSVPLCDLFSWLFLVWKSITLYDLGLPSDPTGGINIFVNDTALKSYTDYFNDVISPLAYNNSMNIEAHPLSEKNRLKFTSSNFDQKHWCSQRNLKGWLTLVISVLASDTALMLAAYNLFIFIAGWIQKRRDKAGNMNL